MNNKVFKTTKLKKYLGKINYKYINNIQDRVDQSNF